MRQCLKIQAFRVCSSRNATPRNSLVDNNVLLRSDDTEAPTGNVVQPSQDG